MRKYYLKAKSINWIQELKTHKFLAIIILISVLMRLYQLNQQSFWFEELMSMHYGKAENVLDFFRKYYQSPDASPPLFSYFVFLMRSVGIEADWAFRLPSVAFGVGTVLMTYLLGKKLIGGKSGIWAAGFTCISGALVYYSQEARYNSMLVFFILSFIYLYVDFHNKKASPLQINLLFLNIVILVLLHYLGMLVMAEIFFLSFLIQWKKEGFSKKILGFCGLIFLVFLPWLNIFMGQLSVWTINKTVNANPNLYSYTTAMLDYAFFYRPYWEIKTENDNWFTSVLVFTSAFLLITCTIFIKRNLQWLRNLHQHLNFELAIVFLMFVGNILLFFVHDSFAKNKYFYEKNLLFTLPFLYLLLAGMIEKTFTEKENAVVTVLLMAAFAYRPFFVINFYHRNFKTEFRQSAEAIVKAQPLPVIVMCGDPRWYEFYFSKFKINQPIFVKDNDHFLEVIKTRRRALLTYSHCMPDPVMEIRLQRSLESELLKPRSLSHVGIYNFEFFD